MPEALDPRHLLLIGAGPGVGAGVVRRFGFRGTLISLVEVAVDKNSTVVFPAPLMSTIGELGSFLAREKHAAGELPATPDEPTRSENGAVATA